MKKILTILIIAFILASCNTQNKNLNLTNDASPSISLTGLAASPETYNGKMITVRGMVTHVCKEGGQKMFLTDSSGQLSLKVVVTKSIPEFAIALEGSTVDVTGKLMLTVIENALENHHEGDEKNGESLKSEKEASLPISDSTDKTCTANISYQLEATSFNEIFGL